MSDDKREYMSVDEHAEMAQQQAIAVMKGFYGHACDVHRIDTDSGTLTLHLGPTPLYRDIAIPRRLITISIAVKVEEA